MQDNAGGGPSLIKLGKMANSRDFTKLEGLWLPALDEADYTWRELLPIAGQVGRQGAPDRADALIELLLGKVEEREGVATALEAARLATVQLPQGGLLRGILLRLYTSAHPDFGELPVLLELLAPMDRKLDETVARIDQYLQLQPGCFVVDRAFLPPGVVETLIGASGLVTVRFDDRHSEYGPATVHKLTPRPRDHFPALVLYDPDRLRRTASEDPAELVKLALRSHREGRLQYRELKGQVTNLLGEKTWKTWWADAKRALKHDPLITMSSGSQPVFKLLRSAESYEDRLRREFDFCKDPLEKLQKVMTYLDELAREQRQTGTAPAGDADLLVHLGNGAAKVAVSVLNEDPSLALAGLALHAEVAARGAAVARPNPKAAEAVLRRILDAGTLVTALPEPVLNRVMNYVKEAVPERWGQVWGMVLLRSGKRMCDAITKGMLEYGQTEALVEALEQALVRPSSSPELLGWLWRTLHTSGPAGKFLARQESLPPGRVADAMFALLDSIGKLYGLSREEKHLKVLENARSALATQGTRPLLAMIDAADRPEAIRLKGLLEGNAGISAAQRTQLLGYLRARFADIFVEASREWEEGGVIYTTEDGLRRTQDALNHIIEIEIPEVAKQIGEAASFGDLSENAEFTAALEKRDQLASRAKSLENELSLAKVINHEMAGSSFVNVGTRVTARSLESGQEEVFTFLGPWDTDTGNKVLNYQAPLARSFMGARPGDTVRFGEEAESRAWEVLAVEAAV